LKDPVEVEIGHRQSPAETVSHAFYPVGMDQRDDLLIALVEKTGYESMMIFTRTKKEADSLLARLQDIEGTNPTALHSDIRQSDRTKALQGFRDGTFNIIVATDIAARGLDISGVTHVINYRVPENPEDYVHRIGRTGRAQQEGDAFTILTADELENAAAVEHYVSQKIERRKLDDFDYNYTALLEDKPVAPLRRKRPPARRRR
jgi:ATP-dependent RNA helicase RhlE